MSFSTSRERCYLKQPRRIRRQRTSLYGLAMVWQDIRNKRVCMEVCNFYKAPIWTIFLWKFLKLASSSFPSVTFQLKCLEFQSRLINTRNSFHFSYRFLQWAIMHGAMAANSGKNLCRQLWSPADKNIFAVSKIFFWLWRFLDFQTSFVFVKKYICGSNSFIKICNSFF